MSEDGNRGLDRQFDNSNAADAGEVPLAFHDAEEFNELPAVRRRLGQQNARPGILSPPPCMKQSSA